jgi:hypothetical protein
MLSTYFGTQEHLTNKEMFHLKKYRKNIAVYNFKQFRIDPAIYTPVNLDCSHCHLVHPSTCCEHGQPYSMSKEAEDRLDKHVPQIIANYLDEDRRVEAAETGYMEKIPHTEEIQSVKTCEGDCFFYCKTDTESFCSIHRYTEEQQWPSFMLKPFSCSLFPLDIIEEQGEIFITALTRNTMSFSRWGSEYSGFLCIDLKERQKADISPLHFTLMGYKPAWEWNRSLLRDSLGESLISYIDSLTYER